MKVGLLPPLPTAAIRVDSVIAFEINMLQQLLP
jgi:hypothetical protein